MSNYRKHPSYQLVVFIDNFHDITIGDEKLRSKSGGEKYDHIADLLTKIATKYDCLLYVQQSLES